MNHKRYTRSTQGSLLDIAFWWVLGCAAGLAWGWILW